MVEQLGIEVVTQPFSGIGELANRRQTILVDLRGDRSRTPGKPGAEVVQEAEAYLAQGVLALLEGFARYVARARASLETHPSAIG
jgi:hypothetical protein